MISEVFNSQKWEKKMNKNCQKKFLHLVLSVYSQRYRGRIKFFYFLLWFIVYCQNWVNLPKDDHHLFLHLPNGDNRHFWLKKKLELGMWRKDVGGCWRPPRRTFPFKTATLRRATNNKHKKQKLASCFASSKKIHPFAVNLSIILLQFVSLFVVVVVVVVVFAAVVVVVVFVSLVLCIEELKEVERWRWIV